MTTLFSARLRRFFNHVNTKYTPDKRKVLSLRNLSFWVDIGYLNGIEEPETTDRRKEQSQ
jgi:hypothetical protein